MTIPFIDLEPVIREHGGRGLTRDALTIATAALCDWHCAGANEHGSFMESEVVLLAEGGKCRARAFVVLTGRGHWLTGHDLEALGYAGSSAAPSVWNSVAFATREDALRYASEVSAAWFDEIATSRSSCVSDSLRRDAERVRAKLMPVAMTAPKAQQLSLF